MRQAVEAGSAVAAAPDARAAGYSRIAMGISSLLLVIVVVLMGWKP